MRQMNGWDTSSRPSWDPQEDPEEGTQALSPPGSSAGTEDPGAEPSAWSAMATTSWDDTAPTDRPESGGSDSRDGEAGLPRDSGDSDDSGGDGGNGRLPYLEFQDEEPAGYTAQREDGQQPTAEHPADAGHAIEMDQALKDFFGPDRQAQPWEDPRPRYPGALSPSGGTFRSPGGGPSESLAHASRGLAHASRGLADESTTASDTGNSYDAPGMPADPDRGQEVPGRQDRPRHRRNGLAATGVVLTLAIVAIAVVLTHMSVSTDDPGFAVPPVGGTAAVPTSTAATQATHKPKQQATAKKPRVTAKYRLGTPATAGGYPTGQDPIFLGMATKTAKQILTAMRSAGAVSATGKKVSAAYQLPTFGQVMGFVGYEGKFRPGKLATVLSSLGSDETTYPAGRHGGVLSCANTTATATAPSGAVCVWATASTLGVVEFFSTQGPETLVSAQHKGAEDTVKLRSGVEAKS